MPRHQGVFCPECGSNDVAMQHTGVADLAKCRECGERFTLDEQYSTTERLHRDKRKFDDEQ